ncbi:enolase-phosphatase E1 [Chelonus insularis]|uniref:enolase-phosphatase E1 n=1 Tax=Chelonus insularis TaxID=460826 RepID=UPI00158A497F|nr:enolase-phosphatase E1 [Chelonus insularis]
MAGEKRNQDHEDIQREETIVLVDIEGTTTSISFVKDTLFPYVRENLKEYITKKWDDVEFKDDVEKLKEQATQDQSDKVEGLVPITGETSKELQESLMNNILWQMDNDRKTGALKQLQGHMWRDAYNSGAVKGHVYDDVPQALEEWIKNGRKVYVYSSGSVEAQKLLFSHSVHGDLLKYFSGYFDTDVGAKHEAASYKKILSKIESEGSKVLFLTDIAKEAKAATEVGMTATIVIREGNAPLTPEEDVYPTIKSFLELSFGSSAKRQKVDETETNKEELKKAEELPKTTVESTNTDMDVEMKDAREQKVEKEVDVKKIPEEEKPVKDISTVESSIEPMECETKIDSENSKDVEEESEDKITKQDDESVSQASTSDIDKPENETKSDIVAIVDDKIDQSKSEPIKKVTENKTEMDKTVEAPSADKMETEVNKVEVVDEKTTEPTKPPEEAPKVENKVEENKEQIVSKAEEKEVSEKPVVEEVKQNGDSKVEITESTTANGSTEVNGDIKEEPNVPPDTKDIEKTVEVPKSEVATDSESAKSEATKEEEEKVKEDIVEKKLNGSTPITEKDETTSHRNGVNDENNKQNGDDDSTTDKESIKVKKVVDSIAEGSGEPDVVSPVAVVAATS